MASIQPISPKSPKVRFGPFALDPASGELRKAGVLIKLQPQPFRLLLLLVERAGMVVTREEIQQCLWSESTFVDFEHGINFSINQIRGALADSAEKPRYIETLPRRGYRFIASFSTAGTAEITADEIPSPASPIPLHRSAATSIRATDLAIVPAAQVTGPRRIEWLAASLAILVLVAALWYHYRLPSNPLLPDLKLRQLTFRSSDNPVKSGAISPDGKYLAFSDTKGMHLELITTAEIHDVASPEGLDPDVVWEIPSSAWLPDSTRFVANAHPAHETVDSWSSETASVWIVSTLGGPPHKLRDQAVSWSVSPDGGSISFSTNKGPRGDREFWVMSLDGERDQRLFEVADSSAVCCLRFFPGSRRISYVSTGESGSSLLIRDLDTAHSSILVQPADFAKMGDFSFLPDGRLLFSDRELEYVTAIDAPINYWVERLDLHTGQVVEPPTRLTNWAGSAISSSSVSAESKRVAFLKSSGHSEGYLAELAPGATKIVDSRRFTREEGGEDAIGGWTADGNTAIVVQNRGDRYAIYKQGLNSDTLRPVVSPTIGWLSEDAVASPDGKWLILENWPTDLSNVVQILRVPLTGGTPELMFKVGEGSAIVCARPPSRLCAVAEQTDDHKQMIVRSFDPAAALNPAEGRGSELARFDLRDQTLDIEQNMLRIDISTDGTRLAAALGPYGPIVIRSLQNQHTDLLRTANLNRIRLLRWAADGKALIVSSHAKGGGQISRLDFSGRTTPLWKCNGDQDNCFGLPSPDGRHLAIYTWKHEANIWMMENF